MEESNTSNISNTNAPTNPKVLLKKPPRPPIKPPNHAFTNSPTIHSPTKQVSPPGSLKDIPLQKVDKRNSLGNENRPKVLPLPVIDKTKPMRQTSPDSLSPDSSEYEFDKTAIMNKIERKLSENALSSSASFSAPRIPGSSNNNSLNRSGEYPEIAPPERRATKTCSTEEIPVPLDDKSKKRMSIRKSREDTMTKTEDSSPRRGHRRTLSSGESLHFAINKPSPSALISQLQKMKIKTDVDLPEEKEKEKEKDKEKDERSKGILASSLGGIGGGVMDMVKQGGGGVMDMVKQGGGGVMDIVKQGGGGVMDIVKQGASMPGQAAKKTSRFASRIMGAVSSSSNSPENMIPSQYLPSYYHGSKSVDVMLEGDDLLQSKEIATSFILSQVLSLIGLNEPQCSEIFDKIAQFIPNECTSSYTNREIATIDNIIVASQKIVKKHNDAKHIVKIQALFRGVLLRKRLSHFVKGNLQKRIQFNKTFALFIEKEEHYIKNLKLLVDRFLTPIRARLAAGKEIIKLEDMSFIFCNIETILEIHQKNLRRLKALLDEWPFIHGVGKAILSIGSSLQAYGIYVGNFKNAQDTVIRLKAEKNSKFNAWVQEIAAKYQDGYDLLTLISLPVNHIAKIEPFIDQLAQQSTGYDKIDEENLNNASSMIRETSKFVTQNLLHSDNTAVITNVQRRITGNTKPLNLIKPDRKFMMETQFTTLHDKKKIYLFLFNDLLLVTTPLKNQFKFKDIILLDLVQFEDIKGEKCAFILKTPNEIYRLSTKTSDEKQQWVKILSSLEESRKVNRTIGVGIQELLDRETSQSSDGEVEIPSILTQCIEHIEKCDGINTEGLFRISGDQREVNTLVDLFDTLVANERDLSAFSIHSVCSVLKLWFRELPDPLLTFSLYDKLVDTERKTSDDDDRGINQFREIIHTLPKSHIHSLKYLLKFLLKVCQNSDVNKMTTNNMAIVFGPTLLRPLTETIETTLNSPIVNRIVQLFIEKFDELFE